MTMTTWRKKMASLALAGVAAAFIAAAPSGMASAADMRNTPPPPPQRIGAPGPALGHGTFAFSHRIQAMVRDGKITQEQAFKLNDAVKRFEKKQGKERRKFMKNLPEQTGISEDTLKELFAPPKKRPAPPHRGGQR